MDLRFSEQQQLLRQTARDFLKKECPIEEVRRMETDATGYSTELWAKMADLGWFGLGVPESYGGMGGTFLDLALLLEEMGRHLLPGPFIDTTAVTALAFVESGSEEQKKRLLPEITGGKRACSFAYTEPSGDYALSSLKSSLSQPNGALSVNGTKFFVPYANSVNNLLCAVRTTRGPALALVDAHSPGISRVALETLPANQQFEVTLKDVAVSKADILRTATGKPSPAQRALDRGALALSAYMAGAMGAVMDLAVDYAKQRVQFGRPIGSFQAMQHRCAEMLVDVEGCRYITYEAAWTYSEGEPYTEVLSAAKAFCSDSSRRIGRHGHQIFGALGFSEEHPMPLYSRRGKYYEVLFGDAAYHREQVAQAMKL